MPILVVYYDISTGPFFFRTIFNFEASEKEETLRGMRQELDAARGDMLSREAQLAELQAKFLQSSTHIMEETIK